jgi:AcrR family transcriptional regulator
VPRATEFKLDADEIVGAAIAILKEQGLDAVSMRSVAARLGVSPVPLYSRVGNKDALVDRIAETLLADLAPAVSQDESWLEYAHRWAGELRRRLKATPDTRLILGSRRWAYVEASQPLIDRMRADDIPADEAVRACRLLTWCTVGFVAMETASLKPPSRTSNRRVAGGHPAGVSADEADALFDAQLGYLLGGLAHDITPS